MCMKIEMSPNPSSPTLEISQRMSYTNVVESLPWLIARLKKMRGTPTFIFSSPTFVVR
jgi:hypothetical protein